MAFNEISTGYKPEFALGGLYQGINAANAQSQNNEELARMFLANQREQQMQPMDVNIKRYDEALANAKRKSPDYIPAQLSGQIGQMQTQEAAGKTASALQPFKEKAERGALENDATTQGFMWTVNDIDKKLQDGGEIDESGQLVKYTPGQIGFMQQKRNQIQNQLMTNPKFLGQQTLAQMGFDNSLERANIQARSAERLQGLRQELEKSPKTAEEVIARLLSKKQAGQQLTQEEQEVFNIAAGVLDAKYAAKVQPGGTTLNPEVLPPQLRAKPEQPKTPKLGQPEQVQGKTKSGNSYRRIE